MLVHTVFENTEKGDCGGTMISDWLVITASHCLRKSNTWLAKVEVEAGSTGIFGGVRFPASVYQKIHLKQV